MAPIKKIKTSHSQYPSLLQQIKEPPQPLYFRGDLKVLEQPCFGIVGTRGCSKYGVRAALEISTALAEAGLVIVSGMAKGIDTSAHKGCLQAKGKTVAVLGTGLDPKVIYPQTNVSLSKKIVESSGLLLSEYSPNTHGSKITFPKRNRIISGLCLGVLIVEAPKGSGALITAKWAKKQDRKLFAIPGPIFASNSWGPNRLIKEGATAVTSAEDILKELRADTQLKLEPEPKKDSAQGKNPEQELVLKALKGKSLNIDQIIEKTDLKASVVASTLTELEIENKVRNLGGTVYALKK